VLSKLTRGFAPSPIIETFNRAYQLRQAGVDLIDFSVGEPDFDTPVHIREAAAHAMDAGDTRYTPVDGTLALKHAIMRKFERDNDLSYTPSEIVVGTGAKPLLAATIQAVLNPGDEAILPTPLWASHLGMVQIVGAKPVLVHTGDSLFKLTPETLSGAITDKTRLLLLCSPSNPSGAVYSEVELLAVASVLRRHPKVTVISDDLYEHIIFDGCRFSTLAQVAPDLRHRVLTINGVSKSYAMTGWRIGYAGGPDWWSDGIRTLFSQTTGSPPTISQAAAVAAVDGPQAFLADWRDIYQRRRDIASAGFQLIDGLTVEPPSGAFYLMPECGSLLGRVTPDGQRIENSSDLADYMLSNGIIVVPGAGFSCDPYFRMSIAASEDDIRKGLDCMAHAIAALR
jgi:aspartate aminotransferase